MSHKAGQSKRAILQGSPSKYRCAARERFGHTAVCSVRE